MSPRQFVVMPFDGRQSGYASLIASDLASLGCSVDLECSYRSEIGARTERAFGSQYSIVLIVGSSEEVGQTVRWIAKEGHIGLLSKSALLGVLGTPVAFRTMEELLCHLLDASV